MLCMTHSTSKDPRLTIHCMCLGIMELLEMPCTKIMGLNLLPVMMIMISVAIIVHLIMVDHGGINAVLMQI